MRITKRLREEAALLCEDVSNMDESNLTLTLGDSPAEILASKAFVHAPPHPIPEDGIKADPYNWWRWWWAEAAQMLREGWEP